jgi:hypothetical protein
MPKLDRRVVLFCTCGQTSNGSGWSVPTTQLVTFLKNIINKDVKTLAFVRTTCPACFERKLKESYGR